MSSQIKYIFADQAVVDPGDILAQVDPEALPADAPPGEANYREAELAGVACAFCTKFRYTGADENFVPTGVCELWEAKVRGDYVSSGYAEGGPTYDKDGNEVWETTYADTSEAVQYHEIHLAGTAVVEKNGHLHKGILRTGTWDETPTPMGKLKRPLSIVRDGKSDPVKGIIALSEIVDNFKAKRGVKKVLVPFAQKKKDDHIKDGNLARVNTGFVDDIWIEDDGDVSHLVGDVRFTDGSVKQMVLDGSVDDVSSGIPFHPQHGAFLEHVALTPYPFIDGQKEWIAASDAPQVIKDAEVIHHVLPSVETIEPDAVVDKEAEEKIEAMTYKQIIAATIAALEKQFRATDGYTVQDASSSHVTISNDAAQTTWTASYTVDNGELALAPFQEWALVEEQASTPEPAPDADKAPEPSPQPAPTELEEAQGLREMRIAASAQPINRPNGGASMATMTRADLEGLELSDAQRTAFESLIETAEKAEKATRTATVDARIEELKTFGFSDRPGFLKLYRDIAMSDDGGPAVVLFSDDGSSQEKITSKDILDRAINALQGAEGKVEFSDQHTQSGNDTAPPKGDGPTKTVEERAKDMRDFLYPNGR